MITDDHFIIPARKIFLFLHRISLKRRFCSSCRALGGILTGDVIIAVNGNSVKRANDLANALEAQKVGDRVVLRVIRSGSKTVCLNVLLFRAV